MYKDFYQMKMEAFINQPLPNVFFQSRSHKEAWHYLAYGINSREPFLLLSGEYGMGKTTLCLKLVQALKEGGKLPFVFVSTPSNTYSALLKSVASCLDIPIGQEDESSVQSLICGFFQNQQDNSRKGISIIVDDVQEMDISTLTKLRLLANFNIEGFYPIRLVLFSHLSFIDKLKIDLLEPLNQRIKRRFYLEPLSLQETREYIYFRLVRAGAQGMPLFTDDAIQSIFDLSRGIPRIINNICDGCLLLGASHGLTSIDKTIVSRAFHYSEGTHVRVVPTAPPPVQPSAEAARQSVQIAQERPEEEPTARVILDYPVSDDWEREPQQREGAPKGVNLKLIVIIAVLVFIAGMVLAVSYDLKAVIESLTDFLARKGMP
jgi:type II secretory pathway predicted ATPase ExeA